jgi:hypothetical protein
MSKRKTDAARLADAFAVIAERNRENAELRKRVRELERGETAALRKARANFNELAELADGTASMLREVIRR